MGRGQRGGRVRGPRRWRRSAVIQESRDLENRRMRGRERDRERTPRDAEKKRPRQTGGGGRKQEQWNRVSSMGGRKREPRKTGRDKLRDGGADTQKGKLG